MVYLDLTSSQKFNFWNVLKDDVGQFLISQSLIRLGDLPPNAWTPGLARLPFSLFGCEIPE